jgi:hypothetical protein
VERFADRLRTGWQKEHPPQQLGYFFDAAGGLPLFELQDFVPDRLGQLLSNSSAKLGPQGILTLEPIAGHPFINGAAADTQLLGHHLLREALFQVEFDRAQSFLEGPRRIFSPSPPRGGGVLLLLLYRFILLHVDTFYH